MSFSMDKWHNKIAIVTGSSSGIGAAIAEKLVDHGMVVVGLARRVDKIVDLANTLKNKPGKLYGFKTDITKENEILQAFEWIRTNIGPPSVIVANAGVAAYSRIIEGNTDTYRRLLDTNFLGVTITLREGIKQMRENNIDGHLIIMNSILGHGARSLVNCNIYPATKHALTALTEILRRELIEIKSKIKISSISPGIVKSNLCSTPDFMENPAFVEQLTIVPYLQPSDVAETVCFILSTPLNVQVHDLIIKPLGELM